MFLRSALLLCAIAITGYSNIASAESPDQPIAVTSAQQNSNISINHADNTEAIHQLTARLQGSKLAEPSGVTPASGDGQYWGLNDSGHSAELHLFDDRGQVLQSVRVTGSSNKDWEALTQDADGNLYIADVGDNGRKRAKYTIYRVPEPLPGASETKKVTPFHFNYSDGESHDAESAFFLNGKFCLITKEKSYETMPTLFCIDTLQSGAKSVARKVGTLAVRGRVTDAAYSAERDQLAVLTFRGVAFFDVSEESDLSKQPPHFTFGWFGKCETICYDGDQLLITNEAGEIWERPIASFLARNQIVPPAYTANLSIAPNKSVDDWAGATSLTLGSDSGSSMRRVQMQWTNEGVAFSFDLAKAKPTPSKKGRWGDALIVMMTPELDAKYPTSDTKIFAIHFGEKRSGFVTQVDQLFSVRAGNLSGKDRKKAGEGAIKCAKDGCQITAVIRPDNLSPSFAVGGKTMALNVSLVESSKGKIQTWSMSAPPPHRAVDKPFTWGRVHFTP